MLCFLLESYFQIGHSDFEAVLRPFSNASEQVFENSGHDPHRILILIQRGLIAASHRKCLATARLSIGKYCRIVPWKTHTSQTIKSLLFFFFFKQKCHVALKCVTTWCRLICTSAIREKTGDYQPIRDSIHCLSRVEQTAILHLWTGHCGLWSEGTPEKDRHGGICSVWLWRGGPDSVAQVCPLLTSLCDQTWLESTHPGGEAVRHWCQLAQHIPTSLQWPGVSVTQPSNAEEEEG